LCPKAEVGVFFLHSDVREVRLLMSFTKWVGKSELRRVGALARLETVVREFD